MQTSAPETNEPESEITTITEDVLSETTESVITEESVTTEETTTVVTTEGTTVATTEATSETIAEPEYSVTPADEKLYALTALNVRIGPGQNYERISHVDEGELVTVTGWADNGWARISFRGREYFVNGNYLSEQMPVVTTVTDAELQKITTALTQKSESEVKPSATPAPTELIEQMVIGWNLGNTLDAPNGETAWGQPTTTKKMIDVVKECGFNTVRIPVSWGKHTDSEYNIDSAWLKRVKEVVDYAIDNDMYVIINSHHDNDYYYPSKEHLEESKKYIQKIWSQVAVYFKDYDYHLIFESMNEPRLAGTNYEWYFNPSATECKDAAKVINELNQLFVDTVRASDGLNGDRYLMVTPYSASPSSATDSAFILPSDSVKDRLILSVHAYTPYDLAMGDSMSKVTFGTTEKNSIDQFMKSLYNKFVSKGVPVIIGETGCINKNNPDERYKWAYYFVSRAKEYGIGVCMWENSNDTTGNESYALFDRKNLKIFDNSLCVYNGIMDAVKDSN